MSNSSKPNWRKILEIIAAIATLLTGFIGGQAAAQNGHIDLFNKYTNNQQIK